MSKINSDDYLDFYNECMLLKNLDSNSIISWFHFNNLFFTKSDIFREWKIWSKCFGKVLIINGVSSVGKTTLCKHFTQVGFNVLNLDELVRGLVFDYVSHKFPTNILLAKEFLAESDLLRIICGFKLKKNNYGGFENQVIEDLKQDILSIDWTDFSCTPLEKYDLIYEKAKEFIFNGQHVVIDLVAVGQRIEMLHYSFRHYPVKVALLYSSLEDTLNRCFCRNDFSSKMDEINHRNPALIIEQYNQVYKFIPKDEVSIKDRVLGVINPVSMNNILKKSTCYQDKLFQDLKSRQYRVKNDEEIIRNKNWLSTAITDIKDSTFINKNIEMEVFIAPNVEYDFIVKNISLEESALEENCNSYVIEVYGEEQTLMSGDLFNKIHDLI